MTLTPYPAEDGDDNLIPKPVAPKDPPGYTAVNGTRYAIGSNNTALGYEAPRLNTTGTPNKPPMPKHLPAASYEDIHEGLIYEASTWLMARGVPRNMAIMMLSVTIIVSFLLFVVGVVILVTWLPAEVVLSVLIGLAFIGNLWTLAEAISDNVPERKPKEDNDQ